MTWMTDLEHYFVNLEFPIVGKVLLLPIRRINDIVYTFTCCWFLVVDVLLVIRWNYPFLHNQRLMWHSIQNIIKQVPGYDPDIKTPLYLGSY